MAVRNRMVISGNMGTYDTWSVGIHWTKSSGAAVFGVSELTAWAERIGSESIPSMGSVMKVFLSGAVDVRKVEIYEYGAGTGPAQTKGEYLLPTPVAGTGTGAHPFYTSAAVSLRTVFPGASYRGRFYWPAVGAAVDNGRFLNSSGAGGLATEMSAFLIDIADKYDGAGVVVPVVYSAAKDLVTPVTSLLVGNKPDTQRSRAENVPEIYYPGGPPVE